MHYTPNEWSVVASLPAHCLLNDRCFMIWTRNNSAAFKAAAIVCSFHSPRCRICAGVNIRLNLLSRHEPQLPSRRSPSKRVRRRYQGSSLSRHEGLNLRRPQAGKWLVSWRIRQSSQGLDQSLGRSQDLKTQAISLIREFYLPGSCIETTSCSGFYCLTCPAGTGIILY